MTVVPVEGANHNDIFEVGGIDLMESRRTISGGADRDEGDEDENQCGEADHEEVGAGDVLLRIPRFLARLCDDLVAFEDDEREAHRAE